MNRTPKIDRARRNVLRAASLTLGAVLASTLPHRKASAVPGNGNQNGNGNGGNGKHKGWGNGGICFLRGTQVRTREGYQPIETLAVGDEVAVLFGGFAPIKATFGHTLNCVAGKWVGDQGNLPILVRRNALGENLPTADLCLTAWHPVYVDGFLVNVGDLVNGTSIVIKAADGQDSLDFFNIELERHDILDAQGAFCESLYRAGTGTERCAPHLRLYGGRGKLLSYMRSTASVVIDRRQPIDVIRDNLEERGLGLARAA